MTVATFSLPSDAAEEQSVVSRAQYGEMGHGGAPRDHPCSMVSMNSVLSMRTMSRSGVVDWSYSDRPYHLRRRLASSTRRLILTVRSAFSQSCPKVHKLGGLLVYLAGCLSNESDPVHTLHQAYGFRPGFRDCKSERSPHCNDNCHHLRKAVLRSRNDARVTCTKHSSDLFRSLHGLLGVISPFLRPL